MFVKGDKVSVLDEDVNGIVTAVKDKVITIESTDGFVMNYDANELLKISDSNDY